eukprot:gb/GEZN01000920.1/.p1 GENE.gb/GEZN01000920.1/~~gb/GEZN01000920.1/.p1  ORF type:complete len:1052 (+),score=142.19 gb/GEZN01000920.1/:316-3156(+)
MGLIYTTLYVTGGCSVAWVSYHNEVQLQKLSRAEGVVAVFRDKQWLLVDQRDLVPGDVVELQAGVAPCDMVVLRSQAVLDESSLTGEFMPVLKSALSPAVLGDLSVLYSPSIHKNITISAGTTILQVGHDSNDGSSLSVTVQNDTSSSSVTDQRRHAIAIITKTGAHTSKGQLLRDILFAPEPLFNFDVEIMVVLAILIVESIVMAIGVFYLLAYDPVSAWFYMMYVACTCVPALLPTVFVVSLAWSSQRLNQKRVICSNPKRLLMAGKVRVACFDKTGTLTQQGMEFQAAQPVDKHQQFLPKCQPLYALEMARAMAVCHTISKVRQEGETFMLVGNVVDIKMFEASDYDLVMGDSKVPDRVGSKARSNHPNDFLELVLRFDFDHKKMTQTSLVLDRDGSVYVYTKGSAEAVAALCLPASLPHDYTSVAEQHSRQGVYLLSMASRKANLEEVKLLQALGVRGMGSSRSEHPPPAEASVEQQDLRKMVESSLNFLGFLLFQNPLKHDTKAALRAIREGEVRTVVVSGDHVLTAIHVGKESEMIEAGRTVLLGKLREEDGDLHVYWVNEQNEVVSLEDVGSKVQELAVTGPVFRELLRSGQLRQLLTRIRIFGRMTPGDKVSVVQEWVKHGWITLMCGDGGNDVGALRIAHVGVALSSAEASIVSPFTAQDKSCMAVLQVLLEGRCALSASFSSYKFMLMYGQIEVLIQVINAYFGTTQAEWCWLWMDFVWTTSMAYTLALSLPSTSLAPARPTSSVLGAYTVSSFAGILFWNWFFLCMGLVALFHQDWFQCRQVGDTLLYNYNSLSDNYETSVTWLVGGWQYVASAMAFNFGGAHRASWFSNWRLVFFVIAFTLLHLVVVLYPSRASCLFRVNCDNQNVVMRITSSDLVPIQNTFNTTIMPETFRWGLVAIIACNTAVVMCWERLVVQGPMGAYLRRSFPQKRPLSC